MHIPILHIAHAIGKEAERQNVKVLGLLGNKPTMTGNFIPKYLKTNYGIQTIIPDAQYIDQNHHFVSTELTQGIFNDTARSFFLEQMKLLQAEGAEGIILGCTELPMLIQASDFDLPMIATT